jgi:hypothetical protein
MIVILLNTFILCLDKYPEHDATVLYIFSILNLIFTFVFTLELIFKLIGLGIGPFLKDGFNCFDFIIVVTSIYGIVLEVSGASNNNASLLIMRTFRCFRIFKLFKIGDLRVLIDSQVQTLPQMLPYMLLLLFFFYIFSLIGMSFFAGKIRFDDNDMPDINGTPVREGFDTLG